MISTRQSLWRSCSCLSCRVFDALEALIAISVCLDEPLMLQNALGRAMFHCLVVPQQGATNSFFEESSREALRFQKIKTWRARPARIHEHDNMMGPHLCSSSSRPEC
mmetsp:Transcript_20915/g.31876  ORF Transcript_20915/g.31876 Transcript_20915/m.31876 type:complete len:107 (-) Transcript_20915:160-480(-)